MLAASAGRVSLLDRSRDMREGEEDIHSKPINFPLTASTPVCSDRMSQPIEKSKTSSEIFLGAIVNDELKRRSVSTLVIAAPYPQAVEQLMCREGAFDLMSTPSSVDTEDVRILVPTWSN